LRLTITPLLLAVGIHSRRRATHRRTTLRLAIALRRSAHGLTITARSRRPGGSPETTTRRLVDRHGAAERVHARAAVAHVRVTVTAGSRRARRGSHAGTLSHAGRRNADDGPGEAGVHRRLTTRRSHSGRAHPRRRWRRWSSHRRHHGLLTHQHGALELGRSCALQIEPTLHARRRSLSVLRTAVGTKHAPPPIFADLRPREELDTQSTSAQAVVRTSPRCIRPAKCARAYARWPRNHKCDDHPARPWRRSGRSSRRVRGRESRRMRA
jgi:hypothetical protein